MARFLHINLVLATVVLGLPGCLLFTDPINEAPVVTISHRSDSVSDSVTVYRGQPEYFWVDVTDDRDAPSTTLVRWHEFENENQGCTWITAASWAGVSLQQAAPQASDVPYEFTTLTRKVVCLCALATDQDGASGNRCKRIVPINPAPVASIRNVSGIATASLPACSEVHVSAAESTYLRDPKIDQITFNWTGADPAGKPLKFTACSGVSTSPPELDRCFYAATSGTYTVNLSITDKLLIGPDGARLNPPEDTPPSNTATLAVTVGEDTPACLQQTEPGISAGMVVLSRNLSVGGTYSSRTFKALLVADDCQPFPVQADSGKSPVHFTWWLYDATKPKPFWERKANTSDSFTLSETQFPNARPQDFVKLRLEVSDSTDRPSTNACDPNRDDTCYEAFSSTRVNGCVHWTTWEVRFLVP